MELLRVLDQDITLDGSQGRQAVLSHHPADGLTGEVGRGTNNESSDRQQGIGTAEMQPPHEQTPFSDHCGPSGTVFQQNPKVRVLYDGLVQAERIIESVIVVSRKKFNVLAVAQASAVIDVGLTKKGVSSTVRIIFPTNLAPVYVLSGHQTNRKLAVSSEIKPPRLRFRRATSQQMEETQS